MTLINDNELRVMLRSIMTVKTRNQIVGEIKESQGTTFHQYNIDKFLSGKDVSLSTLKKLERYVKSSYSN